MSRIIRELYCAGGELADEALWNGVSAQQRALSGGGPPGHGAAAGRAEGGFYPAEFPDFRFRAHRLSTAKS